VVDYVVPDSLPLRCVVAPRLALPHVAFTLFTTFSVAFVVDLHRLPVYVCSFTLFAFCGY